MSSHLASCLLVPLALLLATATTTGGSRVSGGQQPYDPYEYLYEHTAPGGHHAKQGSGREGQRRSSLLGRETPLDEPFRKTGAPLELEYSQALDHLLGRTRDPEEFLRPQCRDSCLMHDYRHLRTRESDLSKLKILVMLEHHCPREFPEALEASCNHPDDLRQNMACQKDLPYAYYSTESHQREIKGYYKSAYTAVFRRSGSLMRQRGWDYDSVSWDDKKFNASRDNARPDLWPQVASADVIIANVLHFRDLVDVFPDKRYIIVSQNDAATLSLKLGCDIEDGRIAAVLQHTSLVPLAENNGALRGDRRHFMWFPPNATRDKLVPTTYRIPELDREGAAKVRVLIPQIYRWRWPLDCGGRADFAMVYPSFTHDYTDYVRDVEARWANKIPGSIRKKRSEVFIPYHMRKFDVTYVGIINHGSTRELYGVNEHRQMAVDAILRLHGRFPHLRIYLRADSKLKYSEFLGVLRDTKVFVSPFGLGEFSGKDYEALLSGALLVKPAAEKLQAYPDIYLPDRAINVKIDFSDLEEVVMPFLKSPEMANSRIQAVHQVLRQFSSVEHFTDDLEEMLSDVLQKPATYDPRGCYPSPTWFFKESGMRETVQSIRRKAHERLKLGEPLYDPDPMIDGDEIMAQLQLESDLRRRGIATVHELSQVPAVNKQARHTDVLDTYSHIVHLG